MTKMERRMTNEEDLRALNKKLEAENLIHFVEDIIEIWPEIGENLEDDWRTWVLERAKK